MSQTKKYSVYLICLISLICFFMFGCKSETPVEDISFKLNSGEQIVLIVGQKLDLKDYVEIKPSYATNKNYTITSFNEDVVRVEGTKLVAVKEDNAVIKVVSNDNPEIEAMMTVVVKSTREQLAAPLNLEYDSANQLFKFDPVVYASSYTLRINGVEIDLGNSTIYDANKYQGEIFDKLLIAQVRANAPDYSFAVTTSGYSSELKVYQAGAVSNVKIVGGVLSFSKYAASSVNNIYFDGELFVEGFDGNILSLNGLDSDYAGKTLTVGIKSTVPVDVVERYGTDVCYDSVVKTIRLDVVDSPELSISGAMVSWQNVSHSSGYDVYVDAVKKATVSTNSFDLKSLIDFDDVLNVGIEHEVKVAPVISLESTGIAKTNKVNSLKVERLPKATVSCSGTDIVWSVVDNISLYAVSLIGDGVELNSSTDLISISMKNQNAGEYTISVTALAQEQPGINGVYYLSSAASEKTFVKHVSLEARINDYILNIDNLGNGKANIDFDVDNFDVVVNGSIGSTDYINLTDYDFEAGEHSITLTRLGDNSSVNSDPVTISFVQLEKIDSVTISDGIVRVVRSRINENATIRFITSGGSLLGDIIIEGDAYRYNTENPDEGFFLNEGNYRTAVRVLGDGCSTLSYREDGVVVDCAMVEFGVLPKPTSTMLSTSESKLTISAGENSTGFDIYKFDGVQYSYVNNINTTEYDFTLNVGSSVYAIRAIGDGEKYLNSAMSDDVKITRLQTPTIAYNNVSNVISKTDLNPQDIVAGYEFAHNGEVVNYDFESSFTMANNEVGNVFTLKAFAIAGADGEYYLDSYSTSLTLTEISNIATVELSGLQNNLIIEPEHHDEEYDLVVEFVLDGVNLLFSTVIDSESGRKYLSNGLNGSDEIKLSYSYSDGRYIIVLIDEDHNAIIEEMTQEFTAKVRFVEPSTGNDLLINSAFSDVVTLNLIVIDETSTIIVNDQNQIVLTPLNQTQEFGFVALAQVTSNFTYIVESNGMGKLMCTGWIYNGVVEENPSPLGLNYEYRGGAYYIDMLDENYEHIIPILNSSMIVQVRYSFDHNAFVEGDKKTDLDSAYTEGKTINIQPETTITRENQTIKIYNVKNTYTYLDYSLLVNNHLIPLDETAVSNGGYIIVDVNYIYENTPSAYLEEVNKIEVFVKNNETSEDAPILSRKSGEIYITRANTVQVSYYKYNNNEDGKENNSAYVTFEVVSTEFEKQYVLEFYDFTNKLVHSISFIDEDAVDGKIALYLDSIEELNDVVGEIKIIASVRTNGKVDDTEVFNSINSDILTVNKIGVAINLRVSESVLMFDAVPNAVGYEVWEVVGTGNVKYSEHLITNNWFEIKGVVEQKQFVVKAISQTGGFTNSTYSESIIVTKVKAPTIEAYEGKFKITFNEDINDLIDNPSITLLTEVVNGNGNSVSFGFTGFDGEDVVLITEGSNNVVIIEPYVLMSYSAHSLNDENAEILKIKIRIVQSSAVDGEYYLNSDEITIDCHGLFAPTDVRKITDNNNTVEMISWTPNAKNAISGEGVSTGYIFKIEYFDGIETHIYYSDDAELKYDADGINESYPKFISGTSAIFPAGYGVMPDGTLRVVFGAGTYKISVQSVPLSTISGYNLFSSKYTTPCEFEIMQTSTLTVVGGRVSWNAQPKATSYEVSIYKRDESLITSIVTTKTEYDFNHAALDDFAGICVVYVKAISSRDDALNSAKSTPLYVYKLPKAAGVSVDDGKFVLDSTILFAGVTIELVDLHNPSNIHTVTIDNADVLENTILPALTIESWDELSVIYEAGINNFTKSLMHELESEGLKIVDGRDYKVNVTLHGNTHEKLGIISSATAFNLSNMVSTKLKANAVEVSLGVVQFMPNSEYATISESGVYSSVVDLNYSFNEATSSAFWHNTMIYKIIITTPNGVYNVYAVDYYSLKTAIEAGTIDPSEYELVTDSNGLYAWAVYSYNDAGTTKYLRFNVFEENKIDLRKYDKIVRYTITETLVDGKSCFSCEDFGVEDDISLIGTIKIEIHALGGDSYDEAGNIIAHLTSQAKALNPFQKYDNSLLSTVDGKLKFANLQPVVDGDVIDNPVYKIEVSLLNSTEKYLFYIYYTTEADAKEITLKHEPETAESAIYLMIENPEETVYFETTATETYIVFDLTKYIGSGTYKATIRTLAGLGVDGINAADYYVNAGLPQEEYRLSKLTDTQFNANAGVLEFAMSYISNDGKNVYYYDYEITIQNKTTLAKYVFVVNQDSEGIKIDNVNHRVSYTIPSVIDGFEVPNGKSFAIKVRALSFAESVINGTYAAVDMEDVVYTFEKSLGVDDVRLEDGVLKWKVLDLNNYVDTIIKLDFLDENLQPASMTILTSVAAVKVEDEFGEYLYHYYQFSDEKYRLDSTGYAEIVYGINYSITLATKGKTSGGINILDSNSSIKLQKTRLETPNTLSIMSNDGMLVWDAVENASSYNVVLQGNNTYTFEVSSTSINFLEDDYKIEEGEYSIQIKANCDGYISSMWTKIPDARGFTKLTTVDLGSIRIEESKIVWDAVEGADAYKIIFEYTEVGGGTKVLMPDPVEETFYTSPGGISGRFTITISPVSLGVGKEFDGESVSFTSSTEAPSQVESFEFNSTYNRFEIVVDENKFLNNDKIVLQYDFEEYLADGKTQSSGTKIIQIEYRRGSYSVLDGGLVKYYYPITIIGKYCSISTMVTRPNALPSNSLQVADIDFNLFEYGEGTEENPYRISTSAHLMNIEYFNSSHYLLIASINLSGIDIAERLERHGAIISETFSGVLNGGEEQFGISGFNINHVDKTDVIDLSNVNNFALFRTINGAIIKNLTIGTENIQLILRNTFANNVTNVVNLSMIATGANNSIIDTVKILNMKVVIATTANNSIREVVNVAGFVVNANSTTIKNSKVKLVVEVNIDCSKGAYLGGFVALVNGTNTKIENCEAVFNVSSTKDKILSYIGGVVACFIGANQDNAKLTNVSAEVEISNVSTTYQGGIVGFAKFITIENSTTSGTMSKTNINYATYIGGIVGCAQSTIISSCGTEITFKTKDGDSYFDTITVSNTENKYIGAIVGQLTNATNNPDSIISYCYMTHYDPANQSTVCPVQTIVTTGEITIGIYGNLGQKVTCSNCSYKIK